MQPIRFFADTKIPHSRPIYMSIENSQKEYEERNRRLSGDFSDNTCIFCEAKIPKYKIQSMQDSNGVWTIIKEEIPL